MFFKLILVCIALFYPPLKACVLSLGLLVLCLNIQECFNPFVDVDLVPEGPKRIPPYISRNQSPLGELLLGFLEYYAVHFRYLLWILQSQVFHDPPTVPGPDYFSLPFLILCRFSGQTLSLSSVALCPASSTLVSCFWLKDRSRWELWP